MIKLLSYAVRINNEAEVVLSKSRGNGGTLPLFVFRGWRDRNEINIIQGITINILKPKFHRTLKVRNFSTLINKLRHFIESIKKINKGLLGNVTPLNTSSFRKSLTTLPKL
jgi:hypothetical protein